MSFFVEFIEFIGILRDLFAAYKKVKSDVWFQDLLKTKDQINVSVTPEEKLAASRALAKLFNSIE